MTTSFDCAFLDEICTNCGFIYAQHKGDIVRNECPQKEGTFKRKEKTMAKRTMLNECYNCLFRENMPGNCHIKCGNPDPDMTGDPHGIKSGWFYYPILFDPIWKTKLCNNYTSKGE